MLCLCWIRKLALDNYRAKSAIRIIKLRLIVGDLCIVAHPKSRLPCAAASEAGFMHRGSCTDYNSSTDLSAAVDVYSDWVDACDAVAKDVDGVSRDYAPPRVTAPGRPSAVKARDGADDDDDDIIDDEDGFGGYGGREEGIVPDDDDY